MKELAIIDLDSMLHLVAYKQWQAGNRTDKEAVKNHVKTFYGTVKNNSRSTSVIPVFQGLNHNNFRKSILKEYKGHRKTLEWVAHWKPTIVEAFDELGGICLGSIESDDAQSIIARDFGYSKCVIVSGDKDMIQVPTLHYNPYKAAKYFKTPEDRWKAISAERAVKELYMQVLTGDPSDMPNELCGIMGVGEKSAAKMIGFRKDYAKVVQERYTEKYGNKGFARANLTYKMVRLLTGESKPDSYAAPAHGEVELVKTIYKNLIKPVDDDIAHLFDAPLNKVPGNLFE